MTTRHAFAWVTIAVLAGPVSSASGQAPREETNYDEAKVGAYMLPSPLVMADGRDVKSAAMWRAERRPELLRIFSSQVYGHQLPKPEGIQHRVVDTTASVGG